MVEVKLEWEYGEVGVGVWGSWSGSMGKLEWGYGEVGVGVWGSWGGSVGKLEWEYGEVVHMYILYTELM